MSQRATVRVALVGNVFGGENAAVLQEGKMKATCIMVFSFLDCVCVFVGRSRGRASAFMRDPGKPKITRGSQLLIVTTALRTAVVSWRIE